ncbi:nitroreductase [Lampropedia cohaerens]|uniref:Nitroreductase n=1 Tax=Lampropedia cohaerens TaxID=1610491 RepID=A0A0U1Q017_9BURK|nr:nitroreductase family protein [Lampropedia cohaerens]KKW68100.1 nitroreductase [Lampropedia cohaerens]
MSTTIDLLRQRRTQYALDKTLPISREATTELIQQAVEAAPSAFNSQSSRVVILFGGASDKVWTFAKDALRPLIPADEFADTQAKLDGFAAGAGTILFFEDQGVIAGLQEQFAAYADNFPVWSEQSSGMAQLAVWTALAEAGIGASLQHYNPLIDAVIAAEWGIPAEWTLRAQMPFGANAAPFGDKAVMPRDARFKVFA